MTADDTPEPWHVGGATVRERHGDGVELRWVWMVPGPPDRGEHLVGLVLLRCIENLDDPAYLLR